MKPTPPYPLEKILDEPSSASAEPRVVLVSGGTGGHIFPALAVGEHLQKEGFKVTWVTDLRGEHFIRSAQQISGKRQTLRTIAFSLTRPPVYGRSFAKMISFCVGMGLFTLSLALAFVRSYWTLLNIAPRLVVGFGGYPSLPVVYAARFLKIPILIHEQNAVLGKANRWIAPHAAHIATSFKEVKYIPSDKPVTLTGNPVRPEISALKGKNYQLPKKSEKIVILVIGGSQGAKVFSQVLPQALALLTPQERTRFKLLQQARPEQVANTLNTLQEMGVEADVRSFFQDMASVFAGTHLVISRSGASSVTELTHAMRPTLFVPYPSSSDDHQKYNAQTLSDAAWIVAQKDFTPTYLHDFLKNILKKPRILEETHQKMVQHSTLLYEGSSGLENGTERLAELIGRLAGA